MEQQTVISEPKHEQGPNTPGTPWHWTAPRQTRLQEVLHEPHWEVRCRIITALADDPAGRFRHKVTRLCSCGNGASFYIDPDAGKVKPWLSRCKDRICPFCGLARCISVAEKLEALMLEHQCDRMMILTIESLPESLAEGVKWLMKCFKRLRRSKEFRTYVTGGAYVIEVTRNKQTTWWHPHLHIAYRGSYYPQRLLKAKWKEISYDSYIVWVSQIHNIEGAAREMAKYVGKPQRVDQWPADAIREYAAATKGLRMVQTFGDCHNVELNDDDPQLAIPDKTERVRLSELLHLARAGYPTACHLLVLVARRWSVFGRYIHHEIPRLAAGDDRTNQHEAILRILRSDGPAPAKAPRSGQAQKSLEKQMGMAFFSFIADRNRGVFPEMPDYFSTGTESLAVYQ